VSGRLDECAAGAMDDIPCESLHSPNFMNRPTSEISDMNLTDGLLTFVLSSDSSSCCSSEAEEESTPNPRNAASALRRPAITVTVPNPNSTITRLRSFSDNVDVKERPLMRKKAATAPPGAISMDDYAPQLPRRAISARLGPSSVKRRILQQEIVVADPLAARRAFKDAKGFVYGRQPRPSHSAKQSDSSKFVKGSRLRVSFSQKARVKKTLEEKNLGRLQTDIVDFEAQGLLTSPNSMMDTPRALQAIPEKCLTQDEPSSPQSRDARRSIMSSLSGSSPSFTMRRHRPTNKNDAKIRPAGWQQIYLPGVICLEEHPAKLRKDSVASLDPFAKGIEPRDKRSSEMVVLDSIMVFFADLGVVEDATEQCLDMYWRSAEQAPCAVASVGNASVTSVNAPQPPTKTRMLHAGRITQGSRFSFSSASSTASQPRSGTPVRQRDKLKRLLSPAFPGSGFLETAADWDQQLEILK
jgi:hypothetical protein